MKNKYERMADCFESALSNLYFDKDHSHLRDIYVCFAIRATNLDTLTICANVVNQRIGKKATVFDWLYCKGFNTYLATYLQKQDYRKRWLESLVAEYRVKGLVLKHKNKKGLKYEA